MPPINDSNMNFKTANACSLAPPKWQLLSHAEILSDQDLDPGVPTHTI